jgi:hypothetical protein
MFNNSKAFETSPLGTTVIVYSISLNLVYMQRVSIDITGLYIAVPIKLIGVSSIICFLIDLTIELKSLY